jgi:hypothetical protein
MFDVGHDQAAGLRAEPPSAGAAVMPVASPAQPARAYEWLCTLAAHLTSMGREVVIVDGSAPEASPTRERNGSHLGLLHTLQDPSIAGLGAAPEGHEWLVMPAALGLQHLQQTARNAGPGVALARLLSPFSPDALVLLFAPAPALATLLGGLNARALVPVLPQTQATLDAYGALKQLHQAGLTPVLAPLQTDAGADVALQPVVDSVADCAERHLGLPVQVWPTHTWGLRVLDSALSRHHTPTRQPGQRPAVADGRRAAAPAQPIWS